MDLLGDQRVDPLLRGPREAVQRPGGLGEVGAPGKEVGGEGHGFEVSLLPLGEKDSVREAICVTTHKAHLALLSSEVQPLSLNTSAPSSYHT